MARLSFGVAVAVFVHIIFFVGLSVFQAQKKITVDLMSMPTNVSIRFVTPQKEPEKTIERVKPTPKITKAKPVKRKAVAKKLTPKKTVSKVAKVIPQKMQPEVLNRIEPAAAVQQVQQPIVKPITQARPVQKAIPVVSDSQLKCRRVQPKYPDRALRMKQEGVVWLRMLLSETGARQQIKIRTPTKYALLNQAAIKAVKKWKCDPHIVNGKATKSWVTIPMEFKIQ